MPDIRSQVAENRRDVQRINARFIFAPERQDKNLSFGRNSFVMTVSIEVYTRSLNNTLISGHPDGDQHGSGHGESGDLRGDWTVVEDTADTSNWTRDGRNTVRDCLAGDEVGVSELAVGTDGTDATPADTTLGAETGRTAVYGLRAGEDFNDLRVRGNFTYGETGGGGIQPVEFGLIDSVGDLIGRLTTPAVSKSADEELRVDITVTCEGDGNGESVVTDTGEEVVVDSLQNEGVVVGIDEVAWGTGTSTPDPSQSALDTEVLRRVVQRATSLERISVSAPQFEAEPASQPVNYTEVGLFDNNGNMIWRTVIDPFEKDSDTRFTTTVGFDIT